MPWSITQKLNSSHHYTCSICPSALLLSIPGKLSGSSLVHVCHKIWVLTTVLLKTPASWKVTLWYVGWFLKLCERRQSSEYTRNYLPNNTVTSQKTSVLQLKTDYLKNVSAKSHSVCKTVQIPAWTGVTPIQCHLSFQWQCHMVAATSTSLPPMILQF
jgi:hypothetical protein